MIRKGKKETVYSLAFSLLSKVGAYLLLLILANLFTKSEFGRASFVLSVYNMTFLFAFLGLSTIFSVWYIKKKDYHSVFYFLAILTFIATIVWAIISLNYPWILPFALCLPLMFLYHLADAILKSKYKYHISQLISALFVFIVALSLILVNPTKGGIIFAYAIGYIITSVWFIMLTRKEIYKIASKARIKFRAIKEYMLKGTVTTLIILSFSFLGWIDSTILGLLSTFENVAVYSIAGPISNILTLIPFSLGSFLVIRISKIKDKGVAKSLLNRVLRVSYTFSIIAAIALVAFLGLIFKIFFPAYAGNEIYSMILIIGILLYGIYFLVYNYSLGKLNPEKGLLPIATAAVVNIILDIILIPKFGLYGITAATTLAHLVAFVWLLQKTEMLKENIKMLIPLIFIPVAFFMSYFGLILIPLCIIFLIKTKLIQGDDIKVIKETLFEMVRIKR